MAGVTTNEVVVPTSVPPHEPVYHLKVVPEPPVADNVVDPPAQTADGLALTEVGATGNGLTVTVTV